MRFIFISIAHYMYPYRLNKGVNLVPVCLFINDLFINNHVSSIYCLRPVFIQLMMPKSHFQGNTVWFRTSINRAASIGYLCGDSC